MVLKTTKTYTPIGVFDSGFGGLSILKELVKELPHYDYLYLGDNARAPYGSRSYESVYEYTLQCVNELFSRGCELVILACNTASAKALRTIQQKDLPHMDPRKRVLGVIRPTTEIIGNCSTSGHVGVLGTSGTVLSDSYPVEIAKFFPDLKVHQQACPMWVPLIENDEIHSEGGEYFIRKYIQLLMAQSSQIDAVILGCTHYPLIADKIKALLPPNTQVLSQGPIVAKSLHQYLQRHSEMESLCSKGASVRFLTTDTASNFNSLASLFYGKVVEAEKIELH